jgi:hypothetical protein
VLAEPVDAVDEYLIEWTTAATFASASEVKTVTVSNTADKDTQGYFTLAFSGESTYALSYNATDAEVQDALAALSTVPSVRVTRAAAPAGFGWRWSVTFASAAGPLPQSPAADSLTVTSVDLISVSSAGTVSAVVADVTAATLPPGYGSAIVRAAACEEDVVALGAPSAVQLIKLYAAAPVTTGEYRLQLGSELTACIDFADDETVVQSALAALPSVGTGRVIVTQRQFLQDGFYYPVASSGAQAPLTFDRTLLVRFAGLYHGALDWPALRVPAEHMSAIASECAVFDKAPSALVTSVLTQGACAAGASAVQAVVAESSRTLQSAATAQITLATRSGISEPALSLTLPLTASAAKLQQLSSAAGLSVSATAGTVAGAAAGKSAAWLVEFSGSGYADKLSACDRFSDAAVGVYDVVTVSLAATRNDLSGTFRLRLDHEVTDVLPVQASSGRVAFVLEELMSVYKVAVVLPLKSGAAYAVDVPVAVTAGTSTVFAAGDWTKHLVVGDQAVFAVDVMATITHTITALSYNTVTSNTELEVFPLMNTDGHVTPGLATIMSAGTATVSRRQLPGVLHMESPAWIVSSTAGSSDVYTNTAGATALGLVAGAGSWSDVTISGSAYTVSGVAAASAGLTKVTLTSTYTGAAVTAALPLTKVYLVSMPVYYTDAGASLAAGSTVWVSNAAGDVDELLVTSAAGADQLTLQGIITSDYSAAAAYTPAHGRSWAIAFKAAGTELGAAADLQGFSVLPEPDFTGTGATVTVRRPAGAPARSVVIGAPLEVQTVALRRDSAAAATGDWQLSVYGELSPLPDLTWGATESDVEAYLNSLSAVHTAKVGY